MSTLARSPGWGTWPPCPILRVPTSASRPDGAATPSFDTPVGGSPWEVGMESRAPVRTTDSWRSAATSSGGESSCAGRVVETSRPPSWSTCSLARTSRPAMRTLRRAGCRSAASGRALTRTPSRSGSTPGGGAAGGVGGAQKYCRPIAAFTSRDQLRDPQRHERAGTQLQRHLSRQLPARAHQADPRDQTAHRLRSTAGYGCRCEGRARAGASPGIVA
jgi:hypothetical protein